MRVGCCLAGLLVALSGRAQVLVSIVDAEQQALPGVIIWLDADAGNDPHTLPETEAPLELAVDQRDKRFTPYISLVRPGATVSFPNSDDIRHHVYSFSEGNAFERRLYRANDAEPVQFSTAGIVALGCNIHDNMQAYVVVSEQAAVTTDAEGRATLPAGTHSIRIWHPMLPGDEQSVVLASLPPPAGGVYRLTLPFTWTDPQRPRSSNQLESLLKQFSTNAR